MEKLKKIEEGTKDTKIWLTEKLRRAKEDCLENVCSGPAKAMSDLGVCPGRPN